MRMNALIPLGIEYADPMRAIATGARAREMVDANQTRNALAAAYAQHGAGAMQGDTNALAGIAQYDPAVAQQLYTGVQDNRRADAGLDLRRQDTQSAIGARAAGAAEDATRTRNDTARLRLLEQETAAAMAKASREEKLAAITTVGTFLPEFEAAKTPEEWDGIARFSGQEDLVGKFGERDVALAMGRGALRGASEETSTLSPGEQLVGNRTGRVIAAGAPKPVESTEAFQTLEARARAARLVPGTPEYSDFMLNGGVQRTQDMGPTFRPATPQESQQYGAPGGQVDEATGRFYPSESKDTTTEGERKAAGYLGRMVAAEDTIGAKPEEAQTINRWQGFGEWLGLPDEWIMSGDESVVRQKQVDWVRSKLRFESGAVIGDDEALAEAATYFPRAGDSPERIAAKKGSRQEAIEQLRLSAGRAAPQAGAPGPAAPPPPVSRVDLKTLPTTFLAQLGRTPPGSRVRGPDGTIYVWDGKDLSAEP